jgi:hypothetical protein
MDGNTNRNSVCEGLDRPGVHIQNIRFGTCGRYVPWSARTAHQADLAQDIDDWRRHDVRAGCGSTERAVFQVQDPQPAIVGSVRAGPRGSRNWPAGQPWPVAPHGAAPYRPG